MVIVSPALAAANNGNWHTAARWARQLRGHCRTEILARWQGQPHELLIALHARRSAASIAAQARALASIPRIVVLTGTDLYRDIRIDTDARRSLELATRLVVLQQCGLDELTPEQRARAAVIVQSASPLQPLVKTSSRLLAVMVGHLRDEKDPLAFMRAARRLSHRTDIRFEHIGDALDAALGDAARATMRDAPNYVWRGGLSRPATRQRMRRAHVLVHASKMEGGAQAIIEAVQAGTPVIASRIAGNIGLLGRDWPALFEVGDERRLEPPARARARRACVPGGVDRPCACAVAALQPRRRSRVAPTLGAVHAEPSNMNAPHEQPVRLTSLSHGGGCGCKIAPGVLAEILKDTAKMPVPKELLVGIETADDAAVYQLNDEQALIATTDFFMPIVDDPFDFGRIAATNAISDVYAMGGRPIMALALVGMPINVLPLQTIARILEGGEAVCRDAGIPIAGGHTIDSVEPIYGLVVLGLVHPRKVKRNADAKPGDVLVLGKPLGVGVLSAALKKDALPADGYLRMIETTTKLNKPGPELAELPGVHALTDITGFGLAGHALELARGANASVTIDWAQVPLLRGVRELASQGMVTGASGRNWARVRSRR